MLKKPGDVPHWSERVWRGFDPRPKHAEIIIIIECRWFWFHFFYVMSLFTLHYRKAIKTMHLSAALCVVVMVFPVMVHVYPNDYTGLKFQVYCHYFK